jgi:hypothetical protein
MLQRLRFDRCKSLLTLWERPPQGRFSTIFSTRNVMQIKQHCKAVQTAAVTVAVRALVSALRRGVDVAVTVDICWYSRSRC